MRRNEPYATTAISTHIALELGQIPEDEQPDEWPTPEDTSGTTMSVSSVSDGETLDPPAVQVHVYEGMEFYDEHRGETITFRTARWFSFRSNPDLDHSRPMDALEVEFEEPEFPANEDSPHIEISGNEFARRLASGRYRNVTGEE